MSTGEIYTHAFSSLRRHEKPVALKYSIRKAVTELGPSGFPFEKFISELFKARVQIGSQSIGDGTLCRA